MSCLSSSLIVGDATRENPHGKMCEPSISHTRKSFTSSRKRKSSNLSIYLSNKTSCSPPGGLHKRFPMPGHPWSHIAILCMTSSATGLSPFEVSLGYQTPLLPPIAEDQVLSICEKDGPNTNSICSCTCVFHWVTFQLPCLQHTHLPPQVPAHLLLGSHD